MATNPPTEWEGEGSFQTEYSPMRAGSSESLGVLPGRRGGDSPHNVDDLPDEDALARWLDRHPDALCLVLCEDAEPRGPLASSTGRSLPRIGSGSAWGW